MTNSLYNGRLYRGATKKDNKINIRYMKGNISFKRQDPISERKVSTKWEDKENETIAEGKAQTKKDLEMYCGKRKVLSCAAVRRFANETRSRNEKRNIFLNDRRWKAKLQGIVFEGFVRNY